MMGKHTLVHPFNGIFLSITESELDTYNNTNAKPGTKGNILCDSICMRFQNTQY
jgi:hypothetical protein